MVGVFKARETLVSHGWLSAQPEAFQSMVLGRCNLMRFDPGALIYDVGDPPGGIYGLVEGAVTISVAPEWEVSRLGHVCWPGSWIGIGSYIGRGGRRIGMRAAVETWMMCLSLDAMDQIERQDMAAARRFAQILLGDFDNVLQAFLGLQKIGADQRIAATLDRIAPPGIAIPVSQTEIASMANVSRKHVNAALHRFEERGWLRRGYRSITLHDVAALRAFADSDRSD